MKEFRFNVTERAYGVLVIYAEDLDEAREKVYSMDGDFLVHNSELLDVQLINE